MFNTPDKFICYIVKNHAGEPYRIARKRFRPKDAHVHFGRNYYFIDVRFPIYRIRNKHFYVYDMDKGQQVPGKKEYYDDAGQIVIAPIGQPINKDTLNKIVGGWLGKQIGSLPGAGVAAIAIVLAIIGAGAGIAIGFMLGNYFPMGG